MMTCFCVCFFYNDTATTDIYTYGITLSLHDALPIYARDRIARGRCPGRDFDQQRVVVRRDDCAAVSRAAVETNAETGRTAIRERSEEHTSELQSLMRISYTVFCLKYKIYKHFYHLIRIVYLKHTRYDLMKACI